MPVWRRHGLLRFTVNPRGGVGPDGALRPPFLKRLEKILDQADSLGMAPIVGCYYFGQDQHVKDEASVIRGVEDLTRWILGKGYGNVLPEVANETNVKAYDHDILKPPRIHELIERVKSIHASMPVYASSFGKTGDGSPGIARCAASLIPGHRRGNDPHDARRASVIRRHSNRWDWVAWTLSPLYPYRRAVTI